MGSLRAQLGALEQEKAGEFESRVKGLQDLSTALQAEQQSRLEAQLELNRQKKRVAGLEAEVQQQRAAMTQVRLAAMYSVHLSVARGRLVLWGQANISCREQPAFMTLAGGHSPGCLRLICDAFACPTQVLDAKSKAEEAAATAAAALSGAERKAKQYRGDNTALLSDYDTWVQNLLAKQSNSGSGSTGTAVLSGRSVSSLVNSSSGAGAAAAAPAQGGWAGGLQSPVRDGGLSRNASVLASPATALPPAGPGADADLERYDRIAALLETRGVSASLSRVLSAGRHSPLPSPGHSAAGGPGASVAGGYRISRATSGASPKPSFK